MKFNKKDWLVIGLLSCILIVLIAGVAAVSFKFREVELAVADVATTKQQVPTDGKDGVDGKTETIVTYLPAKDGKDGQNATDEQVRTAVENYLTEHPVKDGKDGLDGAKGDPGPVGLLVFVRQNVIGLWECKFGNDTGWQPLEECSQ